MIADESLRDFVLLGRLLLKIRVTQVTFCIKVDDIETECFLTTLHIENTERER